MLIKAEPSGEISSNFLSGVYFLGSLRDWRRICAAGRSGRDKLKRMTLSIIISLSHKLLFSKNFVAHLFVWTDLWLTLYENVLIIFYLCVFLIMKKSYYFCFKLNVRKSKGNSFVKEILSLVFLHFLLVCYFTRNCNEIFVVFVCNKATYFFVHR